ncbi:MAG: hypothetical protein WCK10_00075 [Candidatus Staskawiczbacteria bacterium]
MLKNKKIKTKVKKVINKGKKVVKKIVRKSVSKIIAKKEGKLIGRITHYFSDIDVAVINLIVPLKIGDIIRIIGGQETDFEQKVVSMQIDHEAVKVAKKGNSIGIKINEKVHEGYKVYKI